MKRAPQFSLSNLLFEDAADDLEAAYSAGPAAVRNLFNSSDDKISLKKALDGESDGQPNDDKITISGPTATPVGELYPTQREIDLLKSVAYPLADIGILTRMLSSGQSTAGSIAISGKYVLDGHHRWSQVWAILGKPGKILATDYQFPGDQSQKLAAMQLAVAAVDPKVNDEFPSADKPFKTNIMGVPAKGIEKMIKDNIGKGDKPILNPNFLKAAAENEEVAKWAGYKVGAGSQEIIDAIAKKVGENLASLRKNSEAPARADMPQLDHDSIGGIKAKNKITAKLASGEYNVVPPFKSSGADAGKKTKAETVSRRDDVIMERWGRLAGILKD